MIKGILDTKLQRAIVMTFIYEFNEMLQDIANQFPNVYNVDCRDIPKNQDDRYDELHLKSDIYKKLAERYKAIIQTKIQ
jgi:hypothetical protein